METTKLHLVLIAPSRYDEDGYVIRWMKGVFPSNTISCLKSLSRQVVDTDPLLSDVDLKIDTYEDSVERIPIRKIARLSRRPDLKVVVGIVGVQSGQFARASDLALELRSHDITVMIGGFHVSGMLIMFDQLSDDLQTLVDAGVTLVEGEAEAPGAWAGLLRDALDDSLQPIYRLPRQPDLSEAPVATVDPDLLKQFAVRWATIDTSRGCPFNCSFCTIINVQGRKMRSRSAQSVLAAIRKNCEQGVTNYFFTDDNFSRSPIWREVFQGLAQIREEGQPVEFMMQVDTQAWRIPGFIQQAQSAGCRMVFIGMESVNPKNLEAVGKSQNRIGDYRTMVDAWHNAGTLVHVGYIIGFPEDSAESVREDVAFLRDNLAVHEASFFMLTPLPGSVDHKNMIESSTWIDPDLNRYDSSHETFRHEKMPDGLWQETTRLAYGEFYNKENIVNILARTPRRQYWYMFCNCLWYRYSGYYTGSHPMSTGFIRLKDRTSRRRGFQREGVIRYAMRRTMDMARDLRVFVLLFWQFQEIWLLTRHLSGPQWAPLRQLREQWIAARQGVAECLSSNRLDEALSYQQNLMRQTSQWLKTMSTMPQQFGRRKARAMRDMVEKIELYLQSLEQIKTPDMNTLASTQQFISEQLIAACEETVLYSVRLRRRLNRTWSQLKSLRISPLALIRAVPGFFVELYLAIRFGYCAIRQDR